MSLSFALNHCRIEPTAHVWDANAQVETDPGTGVPFLDDKDHSRMWAISPFQSKARIQLFFTRESREIRP